MFFFQLLCISTNNLMDVNWTVQPTGVSALSHNDLFFSSLNSSDSFRIAWFGIPFTLRLVFQTKKSNFFEEYCYFSLTGTLLSCCSRVRPFLLRHTFFKCLLLSLELPLEQFLPLLDLLWERFLNVLLPTLLLQSVMWMLAAKLSMISLDPEIVAESIRIRRFPRLFSIISFLRHL